MRRLLRWAFNFAAAVSVVLFVGVCVLWVRSYFAEDGPYRSRFWLVAPGSLLLPYWFLLLMTAALPLNWLGGWMRGRRRPTSSLCPRCGYERRATHNRCPKCGTVTTGHDRL